MNIRKQIRTAVVTAAPLVVIGAALWQPVHADDDSKKQLIYAEYKTETAAMDVFKALESAEGSGAIKIDSYAVVSKGLDGTVKVEDQRQKGSRAGAAVGMPKETLNEVKSSLMPGESAIVAVVDDRWAAEAERLQEAKAARVTSYVLPVGP